MICTSFVRFMFLLLFYCFKLAAYNHPRISLLLKNRYLFKSVLKANGLMGVYSSTMPPHPPPTENFQLIDIACQGVMSKSSLTEFSYWLTEKSIVSNVTSHWTINWWWTGEYSGLYSEMIFQSWIKGVKWGIMTKIIQHWILKWYFNLE